MRAWAAEVDVESSAEDNLIGRARQGDIASFEALYRRHVGRVHALCRRLCGDRGRAEDLTQDVFVRAWQRLGTFRGESLFSSWLHRLAVNVVLGEERSRSRRPDLARPAEDIAALELGGPDPERTGSGDLERAIAALPPGAREVFVLHDVEGYRHEEIAEMTGRSAGTCKAQLHRARSLLREALT